MLDRSAETSEEYKKILEEIFPGINLMELRGLSRKELLELIPKENLVYTRNPEYDVAAEPVSRIYSSASNSKPQLLPEEMYNTSYTEQIQGRCAMSAATALSSPNQRSPLRGPSNTVSSLYPLALNVQTTSALSPAMNPPQPIWESQFGQQMLNTYNYYPTTCTGDHLGTYLRQHITPTPLSVDVESHLQSGLYPFPLWEYDRLPLTASEPAQSSAELHLDALHSSTTGCADQNRWCYPTLQLDIDGLDQTSGNDCNSRTGPRNGIGY